MQSLTVKDFASAFGVDDLPQECKQIISEHDFRFAPATADELQELVLETLKKLDGNKFSVVGQHRKGVWEKGWGENLKDFVASDFDPAALLPKYYSGNPFVRFRQCYIRPSDRNFELNFYTVLRTWL